MSDTLEEIPLFCSVCDSVMSSKDDDDYHIIFGCCKSCGMKWAEIRREDWMKGWRPLPKEIDDEMLTRRSRILNAIDIVRG